MGKIKDFLLGTASGRASSVKLPSVRLKPAYEVTQKAGKPGSYHRRIIRQEVMPPRYVQTGVTGLPDARPIMQGFMGHRYLHATKGWRQYANGLPGHRQQRRPADHMLKLGKGWKLWRPATINADGRIDAPIPEGAGA